MIDKLVARIIVLIVVLVALGVPVLERLLVLFAGSNGILG